MSPYEFWPELDTEERMATKTPKTVVVKQGCPPARIVNRKVVYLKKGR